MPLEVTVANEGRTRATWKVAVYSHSSVNFTVTVTVKYLYALPAGTTATAYAQSPRHRAPNVKRALFPLPSRSNENFNLNGHAQDPPLHVVFAL